MVKAEIPFKSRIFFDGQKIYFSGPVELENKLQLQKSEYGANPVFWQAVQVCDSHDILLNEFILKCQNNYQIPYAHEEICHCRMVPTDKVLSAIKQGLNTISEISRVTMAGTGCGSCKKDIEDLVKYLVK